MINVSDEFKEAFLSAAQKQLKLVFDDGTTIENEDISFESMSLEQTLCDSDELKFGKVSSACFKVNIVASTKRYKNLWFNAFISVGEHSIQLGRFKVQTDHLTSDRKYRDIVAYDAIYEATNTDLTDWYKSLSFPLKQKSFRDKLFQHLGIQQLNVVLPNDDLYIRESDKIETLNGLEVMQALCEMNAVWGTINYQGKFKYIRVKTVERDLLLPRPDLYPSQDLYPDGEIADEIITKSDYRLGSLTYEEFEVKPIEKLIISQEEQDYTYIKGNSGNTYVLDNNILLYKMLTDSLQNVANSFFEYANYLSYTPGSLTRKGAPWLEIGDLVKVIADKRVLLIPILIRKMSGITALKDTYTAKGSEEYGKKPGSVNDLKIKIRDINRNLISSDKKIQTIKQDVQTKAPKEEIVSLINESDETIVLRGNRVVVESENWTVNADGSQTCKNMTISGGDISLVSDDTNSKFKIHSSDKKNYCQITPGLMQFYRNAEKDARVVITSNTGMIRLISKMDDGAHTTDISGLGIYAEGATFTKKLTVEGTTTLASSPVISSDRELKKEISEIENASEFIYALKPCKYKYINGTSDRFHHGFIAQEVKDVMKEDWGVYISDSEEKKGIRYEELIADLVDTVQEQNKRIKALEERLGV